MIIVVVSAASPCATGYYSTGSLTACLPCDAGHQCTDQTIAPVECLAGTYSSSGAATCTDCDPGASAPRCHLRVIGWGIILNMCQRADRSMRLSLVKDDALQKECLASILRISGCLAGYLLCLCCLSGEYCPNDGMTGPLACPSGTYTLTSGQSACTDCNPGAATALVALCCFQQQYNCNSLRNRKLFYFI